MRVQRGSVRPGLGQTSFSRPVPLRAEGAVSDHYKLEGCTATHTNLHRRDLSAPHPELAAFLLWTRTSIPNLPGRY